MADMNLQKIFNDLGFTENEKKALAKSIQIMKEAELNGDQDVSIKIQNIITEVAKDAIQ